MNINLNEKQSQSQNGRFNRPVRIDVLIQDYVKRVLYARLAELDKEIFADE